MCQIVDGSRGEEDINYNAVRDGCASGFGKQVVGCNGEVREGASIVGVGDTASCLIHALISLVE